MNKMKIILILFLIIVGIIGLTVSKDDCDEKIIDVVSGEIQNELETKIVLYFSNGETGELAKEYRYVKLNDVKADIAGTIINELLKGPSTEDLISAIPNETKINSISEVNNKIVIDFSKEYEINSEDELIELNKVYSIVNSLTEIMEIDEVEIKVDGKTVTSRMRL